MAEPHPLFKYDGHMNTVTGIKFNIFDPKPEQINIYDIAYGLAFKGHFCGQSPRYFSIAQHCLLTVSLLPESLKNSPKIALVALLHDASEAYIGDMIKPIKIHFPLFVEMENKIMVAVFEKFNLDMEYMAVIKKYDSMAQELEYCSFYKNERHFLYLTPDESRVEFLRKFDELNNLLN